ncbi:MAG: tyrosine-type recombinase/integrase [Leucobacter sp.]
MHTTTQRTPRKPAAKRNRDSLGSVEQLPSGRYRARYFRDGAQFKAPHTFPTKAAAYDWLAAERSDRARGTWHDPRLGRETLAEYVHNWLAARVDLSPRTAEHYQRMVHLHILPKLGAPRGIELGLLPLGEITPATVRAWRAAVLTTVRERIAERRDYSLRMKRRHPARAWATSHGIDVPLTGRLPEAVLTAWKQAGSPEEQPTVTEIQDDSADPGAATTAGAYTVLRAILNDAVKDGLIPSNPCQIKGGGIVYAKERPTATPAEVGTIAAAMPAHLAAAVIVAAWSGLRFGELFGLARKHVNLDAGTVRVERALVELPGEAVRFTKPKTHSSRRTVHLPPFVAEVLRDHMQTHTGREQTALVFTSSRGLPITRGRLTHAYQRARLVADRPDLRWHDLRHTGATLAYTAGASVREVQNRLGHSTMRAASIYAHAADDGDRILADRLNALYAPPLPNA